MTRRFDTSFGVSITALSAFLCAAGAARAQQPTDTAPGPRAAGVEEVTVTGTRIRRSGMSTPVPVTVLSGDTIEKVAPGNMIDALDSVPAFFQNQDATTDAGSGVSDAGGSGLNLRGLGINRTLALLDGRRLVPNNKQGTVNVDVLPSALIERVEIVTGGASAAYGTDAVAGVVNFILDDDFTGLKGDVQSGISDRNDNANRRVELTWGAPIGDKLHLILSGEYYAEDAISDLKKRDWVAENYAVIDNPAFLASGELPRRVTAHLAVPRFATCGGLIDARGSAIDRLEFHSDGSVTPFVESGLSGAGGPGRTAQSIAPEYGGGSGCMPDIRDPSGRSQLTNGHEVGRFFSHLRYELNDNLTYFAQVGVSNDELEMGRSGNMFAAPWDATVYQDNAFLPDTVRQTMVQEGLASFKFERFNDEIYPNSRNLMRNRTAYVTSGFDAEVESDGFFDGWRVNAYYQYSKNEQRTQFFGKQSQQKIFLALDAVVDPATGEIVCHAALLNPDLFGDCVPINLFGEGNASAAAIDYVTTPLNEADAVTHRFDLTQNEAEVVASGDLWKGWGAGAIAGAFGVTYRKQELVSLQTGAGANFEGLTNSVPGVRGLPPSIVGDRDIQLFDSFSQVDGGFDVRELFAEIDIPIVSEAPAARELSATLSGRVADYSGSGSVLAYKFGLDWQVTTDLRLRGTTSRDVRAATLSERFDSQRTNGTVTDDPVTGLTYNFSQTTGGNPEVDPEKADTVTAGIIYQPSAIEGLGLSVDWWRMEVNGAIGQLGTQRIVDDCSAGALSLCALITRDPQTQVITDLRNVFININQEKATGVDIEVTYARMLRSGSLNLRMLGTRLGERSFVLPGAPTRNQVGELGTVNGGGYPEFQGVLSVDYSRGPFSIWVQERYVDGGLKDKTDVEGVDIDDNSVPSVTYTDLRFSYDLDRGGRGDWEFYLLARNLFDRDPPLIANTFSFQGTVSQTNSQLYDVKGRRYQVGARFRF